MNNNNSTRIDEVSQYYSPIEKLETISTWLFWINAVLSLIVPHSASLMKKSGVDILQALFVVSVIISFGISALSSLHLIPQAELMRRKQLISDSFGVPLSQDKTLLYYNNPFPPSVQRLGASIMENALFSKEIASGMLVWKRIKTIGYFCLWLFIIFLFDSNFELIMIITQLVFSGEIIIGWWKLEVFRVRCHRIYDDLYSHFLQKIVPDSPPAIATVLNAFVNYESAKSAAGILLSSDIFKKLNPSLSQKWQEIYQKLDMGKI